MISAEAFLYPSAAKHKNSRSIHRIKRLSVFRIYLRLYDFG